MGTVNDSKDVDGWKHCVLEYPLAVRHRLALVVLALCVASGLAGCSKAAAKVSGEPRASPAHSKSFEGPWSDLLQSTYKEATSNDERAALDDGVVSDQEYAYFQNKIVKCLSKHGLDARFSSDGSLEYTNKDHVGQDVINGCNEDHGLPLLALRDAMNRNPENLDENEIMVACLRRAGLIDAGYTAAMYAAGTDADKFMTSSRFGSCNSDPLHYLAAK
jgi:hypothetical protein